MATDNNSENLKVFISYARQDSEAANRLYNDLKLFGLDPWLDTESLLGGENWRASIKEAIMNSRYFIPLLSSNSVEKIGYLQRELKEALEVLLEFPQSKRFIIPVRLEETKIRDEKLRELHTIDLFPEWKAGVRKMLGSMGVEVDNLRDGNLEAFYQYDEWNELLNYIYEKKCCPFVGPDAHTRWIPANKNIAIKWAEEHGYPFQDRHQLPQVAQYMAITKGDNMYPKKYLCKILRSVSPPDFAAPEYKNTVYAVLADLNLPIYITTNYDHLMEEALISKGKDPKSEFCIWNKAIVEYARRAEILFVSEDPVYVPSPANPFVFHLHGDMDHPLSMVLTEQDYLNFIVNMNSLDRNQIMLPSIIRRSFATSSQLFIGFTLNDLDSRILFMSIGGFLSVVESPYSVAIMTDYFNNANDKDIARVKGYLSGYAKTTFDLNIHWSDPFMFSMQLRNGYEKFRQRASPR
jgi:hypothetical protein